MRLFTRCLPAMLAVLAYFNAVDGSYHFDDGHSVVDNPFIRSTAHLLRFFTDPTAFSVLPQNQTYRPLLLTSYALTAEAAGTSARAFLTVNLLIHVGCVLVLQALLRRVLPLLRQREDERLVLVASALFAVHPLLSECVNYVSARSESLCALLSLGAMLAYLRARERDGIASLIGAAALMFAAFLVKPVAIAMPFAVLLLEAVALDRQDWPRIVRRWLWLAIPAALGMLLAARMTPPLAIASASGFSRLDYARSELPALLYYAALFAWPTQLNADHAFAGTTSLRDGSVLLALLVLACVLAFIVRAFSTRRNVAVAFGLAWFFIQLLPSSSVFPLAELVAERRVYLAAAGLCPLLAAVLLYGPGRFGTLAGRSHAATGWAVSAVTIGLLVFLTHTRNQTWKSEETLWRDVAAKAPKSGRAHMNYGLTLMAQGRMAEAEPELRDAIRFAPYYSHAHINLGVWLLHQGHPAEARERLDHAIALRPDLAVAHLHRGLAAEKMGEPAATRARYFGRAVALSPNHVEALSHWETALRDAGDLPGAEHAARRLVELRGAPADRLGLANVTRKQLAERSPAP